MREIYFLREGGNGAISILLTWFVPIDSCRIAADARCCMFVNFFCRLSPLSSLYIRRFRKIAHVPSNNT